MIVEPHLRSWVETAPDSPFPIQNLPYGVFTDQGMPVTGRAAVITPPLPQTLALLTASDIDLPLSIVEPRLCDRRVSGDHGQSDRSAERVAV